MNEVQKRENRILFAIGFCIGLVCFLLIYGVNVLDFTYDGWLFRGDPDLRQHYLGWCHYRTSPWTFPIGMIDSLSYPTSVSMLWTDSIPLFAILFKLFRSVLPETFQYFGMFAFLSFGMQGGLAVILIRKVTNQIPVCILMSIPFVLSYPILHRTFYHTSLAAQWIILLAIYLWLSGINKKSVRKQMVIWGAMGILCVLIHSYFLPMVACIMCGSLLEGVIRERNWKAVLYAGVGFCVCAVFVLYFIGAFEGHVSPSYDIGGFEMNLNSFVNSLGYSRILPELSMHFDTQYEGFAYLGVGMLLLVSTALCLACVNAWIYRKTGIGFKRYFLAHPRRTALLVVLLVFLLAAACPHITLGNWLLVRIPYPKFIKSIAGIFRSNGRFAWPIIYLLLLLAIGYANRKLRKPVFVGMILVCLLLQLFDLSAFVGEKRSAYCVEKKEYQSAWDKKGFGAIADEYDCFVMFARDNPLLMTTAYYAYQHDMKMTRYYYARDIDKQIEENLKFYEEGLKNKEPEADCVYVFDVESYENYKDSGLHFYPLSSWFVGTAAEIDGVEEVE